METHKAASRHIHRRQRRVSPGRSCGVSNICQPLLLAALIVSLKIGAQATPQTKDIRVGDRAPQFTLTDQNDREFSLANMVKKGPVAMVFVRSVQWCSYCQLQTIQLSKNLEKIQAAGGQVVMICYDAPDKVKRFAQRCKLTIPILSDSDSKTIEAYGMRATAGAGEQIGASQHGTFVIDQSGIVRSKPYLTSFEGDGVVDALARALKDAAKPETVK